MAREAEGGFHELIQRLEEKYDLESGEYYRNVGRANAHLQD